MRRKGSANPLPEGVHEAKRRGWKLHHHALTAACGALLLWAAAAPPAATATSPAAATSASAASTAAESAEIKDFNRRFAVAGLHMDNAAIVALYTDDCVSLLPGMSAMVSKKNLASWLDGLMAQMQGYRVTLNDLEFHDIRINGDWASEWGTTHQVVQPPGGKPALDNHGKILLVLRRETAGGWKIVQEMWNAAPAPEGAAPQQH